MYFLDCQMSVRQHKKKKERKPNYMHLSVQFFQIAGTHRIHDD